MCVICALSRTVRSHDRDAFSRVEVKGDILECHPPVITHGDILHIEDGLVQFMVGMRIHVLRSQRTIGGLEQSL